MVEIKVWYCTEWEMNVLKQIEKRLYSEARMNADEMRDLANKLNAIRHTIEQNIVE